MKDFRVSFLITIVCLCGAASWGAKSGMGMMQAVVLATMLGVMEVSLSFDNAVVNASVLKEMDAKWQQVFLTIGVLIAVFGMRLLFPIVIVSVATGLGMADVATMALERPEDYSNHLSESHAGIAAFGGLFLLLVFLSFLFDEGKELHWLGAAEERLASLGKLDSIAVMTALVVLFCLQMWLPLDQATRLKVVVAGLGGVILFVAVSSLDSLFESESVGEGAVSTAKRDGAGGKAGENASLTGRRKIMGNGGRWRDEKNRHSIENAKTVGKRDSSNSARGVSGVQCGVHVGIG